MNNAQVSIDYTEVVALIICANECRCLPNNLGDADQQLNGTFSSDM